jgi:thymidylate synthase (FAD)
MQVKPSVTLLQHTPDPLMTIAWAARLCYSAVGIPVIMEKMTEADAGLLVGRVLSLGHISVLEHASFTFGIEGISRAASHQLVRHRIASYSQQSQRYVKLKKDEDINYIEPETISSHRLQQKFKEHIEASKQLYNELVSEGIPAEDARYVLPNAVETKIIVTMNARELYNYFSLRCCNRAQWEIRQMSDQMLSLVYAVMPTVFGLSGPGCLRGPCPEGKMCCGVKRTMDDILTQKRKI